MAEENTGDTGQGQAKTGEGQAKSGEGGSQQQGEQPRYTQADIDRVRHETALEEQRKAIEATERDRKKAEKDELAKKSEWETLAKRYESENENLKAEIKKRDRDALRAKVAGKHKLPEQLAARLAGETEAEMDADAQALAKLVAPPKAPNTNVGAGNQPSPGPGTAGAGNGQARRSHRFLSGTEVKW